MTYAYVTSECAIHTRAAAPGARIGRDEMPVSKHPDFVAWRYGKRETRAIARCTGADQAHMRRCARAVVDLLGWGEGD